MPSLCASLCQAVPSTIRCEAGVVANALLGPEIGIGEKVEGGEVLEQLAQGRRLESDPVGRLQLGFGSRKDDRRRQAVGHVAAEAVVVVEAPRNLITANATFTSLINVGQAETQGVEAFASVAVTERLKLRGDYTFPDAGDAITGLELLRRPWNKASVTAVWTPIDPLVLSATVLHVGPWVDISRDASIPRLLARGIRWCTWQRTIRSTRK